MWQWKTQAPGLLGWKATTSHPKAGSTVVSRRMGVAVLDSFQVVARWVERDGSVGWAERIGERFGASEDDEVVALLQTREQRH